MASIVQAFWFGTHLPTLQELSLRSFLLNGHEYHLYAYEPIDNVPAGVRLFDASSVLPRESVFTYQRGFGKGSTSAFSNQFRYRLLLEKGGWWVDTDVVCLRPFEFASPFVFASERGPDGEVSTASCVIRAPAGQSLFAECLDVIDQVDRDTLEWGQIGPRLLDTAVTRHGLLSHRQPPDAFNPIDYHDFQRIVGPGFDERILSASFAVHLWNQKWKTNLVDPSYPGPPDSLYARLWHRYLPSSRITRAELEERHEAFLRENLARVLHERNEARYSLDDRAAELEAARAERATAEHALSVARAEIDAALEQAEAARAQLNTTEAQLAEARGEVATSRRELDEAQQELAAFHVELARIHEKFVRRGGELEEERHHLSSARSSLNQLEESLVAARDEVSALRSSLSWRLTRPLRVVWDLVSRRGRTPG